MSLLKLALACALTLAPLPSLAQAAPASTAILHPADLGKLLPDAVFFRGQTATTQARNSGGIKFADGLYLVTALVDNSGYSTGIQEKYQAYLLTEVPLDFHGQKLIPGSYGIGIIKPNGSPQFVVQDIGAHDLFTVDAATDAKLHRPTPLQVVAGEKAGSYRLYFGRNYIEFTRAE
ncbi:hypothetical protein [Silvibacterium dinghuense]|uniref:Uncharacterized protein n=1 Tax=Silvibacterium dinghuense TaxID=1560006 RepID=A0A4Q1SGD7_9BACT|nr:hypothetical protein [Silvibacterium dinghuense]RXS96601.1 hypothetical protein ESZ00_01220 [Silvibacterium dinghuense]GGG92137.1 hypothetical protein GCM10011586_03500 [Silvibacterium dinghuense]